MHREIGALQGHVGSDVDMLEMQMQGIDAKVGVDPGIGDMPFGSVWDGVAFVNATVEDLLRDKVAQTDVQDVEKDL